MGPVLSSLATQRCFKVELPSGFARRTSYSKLSLGNLESLDHANTFQFDKYAEGQHSRISNISKLGLMALFATPAVHAFTYYISETTAAGCWTT